MNADYTPEQMIRDARMLSIFAVAASGITLIFVMWALSASGNFEDSKDPITFSLALLQTFIALGAFAGFWVIRSSAREAARDAARSTVSHYMKTDEFEVLLLKELKEPEVSSIINRSVQEWLNNNNVELDTGDDNELARAAGDEDGGIDE